MEMYGVNSHIYYYYIKAEFLSKYLVLPNLSSGVFNNAVNVMVFAFLRIKFITDLTWYLP